MKPDRRETLRLSAIAFTDIVGYSALVHRDPALGARALDRQRGVVRGCVRRFGGREIETAGDSFLLEFESALVALECIAAIQSTLRREGAQDPPVQLRASIHLGDVEHRGREVFGDGVNVSARILPFAPEGGVAFSDVVNRQVQSRLTVTPRSIGTHALKNIAQPVEIFALDGDALAAMGTSSIPALPETRAAWRPRTLAAAAGLVAATAALFAWYPGTAPDPTGDDADKSVAVLPFANLSGEADSQYFTDGLHDSVITHMAGVADLKVISRTSVMRYRDAERNLREIASDLGVAHVVEGSVQRVGSRLQVNAQLIRTATDTHVWATRYNRDLSDVFAVQAELAEQIVQSVHARLRPEERARIERAPTLSHEAYELYLRALALRRRFDPGDGDFHKAVRYLNQALALDPQFALAHALLSNVHDAMYWNGMDRSEARLALARDAADAALRIDPDLAEGHVARAIHLYHGSRNYEAALRELEHAQRLAPNSGHVHAWLAYIYRRQSRWEDALRSFARVADLDPRNEPALWEYGVTLGAIRRYEESDRVLASLETFAGDVEFVRVSRGFLHLDWKGTLEPLAAATQQLPDQPDSRCVRASLRWQVYVLQRRFPDAAAAALECASGTISLEEAGSVPKEYLAAEAFALAGDAARSRPYYRTARAPLEALLQESPALVGTRVALASTLAALGQRPAALEQVELALRNMPVSRDAIMGALALALAAEFHARNGEPERALDQLEQALTLPWGTSAHAARLSPYFTSLHGHPRFEKMIQDNLPR